MGDARWMVAGGAVASLCLVACLLAYLTSGFLRLLFLLAAASCLAAIHVCRTPTLLFRATFLLTLAKNRYYKQAHHTRIVRNIHLGALPLASSLLGHSTVQDMRQHRLGAVLALVAVHELRAAFSFTPATQEHWRNAGVDAYMWIVTPDYEPVAAEELVRGADFLHAHRDGVYVHCKAGRGRSSACVAVYLVKYEGMQVEEALQCIRSKRPQMHLNKAQRTAVDDAAALVRRRRGEK